jgi:PIN domain nuclease of toxin-antitoxin system
VKLLLDTHTLIWWWAGDSLLSQRASAAIADEANTILVSAASAWEIAIKYQKGKLPIAESMVNRFAELAAEDGLSHLAMSYQHALKAASFDSTHQDPFDRMLAAQASIEGALLVTCDPSMKSFRLKCYW